MAIAPSKIFAGFRALGFVSNHVPLVTRYHKVHKENYVITCVGKAFHVYNASKLGIVAISDTHPDDISVVAVDRKYVYTGAGCDVFLLENNKKIKKTYKGHKAEVNLLLAFGLHVISVDIEGTLIVWDTVGDEQYLQIKFDSKSFSVSVIAHPHTYKNKILLGSEQGSLQLWNIKSNKLIYTFNGWGAGVTAIAQSTAVDVMAIGLCDGQIILHNLSLDKTVMKFKQDYGPVTNIGFRTDGHPIMVTGSAMGHIALWDLENKKLHSYLEEAHNSSVTGLVCLPSEPLMITSAADNSLKVWIFDLPDAGARLLHLRQGHSAPPTHIRFYNTDGQNILTAGQDSTLRSFSTIHDKHNKSLGRASYHKKLSKKSGLRFDKHQMPPVVKFAAEPSRQSDWDNILACHRSLNMVTTWSYIRSTMGKHKFAHDRFESNVHRHEVSATAVEVTACGNFGLIGYSSGDVDMYNMQSGLHRGSFGEPKAHDCTVRGIACDGLNQKVVTAGADGVIRFWRFKNRELLGEIKMEAFVSQIFLHRESSMMAVALDDFTIPIVDIDTKKQVRHFKGHSAAVTDMTFSKDGRWLISSGMDCSIRTWSLPTGSMIDVFLVSSAATSISMSPSGNFIATSHVGDVGIYLWSNKTLYSFVSLMPLPEDFVPREADMPVTSVPREARDPSDTMEETAVEEEDEDAEGAYKSVEQISDELVTLSLLPTSRWLNLLNLDVIKMRNKPKEPPKAPKAAPFFLPTVASLTPSFDFAGLKNDEEASSRIRRPALGGLSDLAIALTKAHQNGDYSEVLKTLKAMGPSAIDAAIRTLGPEDGGSVEVMQYFIQFIIASLETNKDFELAHSYLALFLKVHGDELSSNSNLSDALKQLMDTQFDSWDRIKVLMQRVMGMVNYLRSATV